MPVWHACMEVNQCHFGCGEKSDVLKYFYEKFIILQRSQDYDKKSDVEYAGIVKVQKARLLLIFRLSDMCRGFAVTVCVCLSTTLPVAIRNAPTSN